MRFWMSGEVQDDIADAHRIARKEIEQALTSELSACDYGLQQWAFISMITPWVDDEDYPEVKRYRKKERTVEFRLRIDHKRFKAASPTVQLRLLAESALRSFDLLVEKKPPGVKAEALRDDVQELFRDRGWCK
jgi:hypothetical protein